MHDSIPLMVLMKTNNTQETLKKFVRLMRQFSSHSLIVCSTHTFPSPEQPLRPNTHSNPPNGQGGCVIVRFPYSEFTLPPEIVFIATSQVHTRALNDVRFSESSMSRAFWYNALWNVLTGTNHLKEDGDLYGTTNAMGMRQQIAAIAVNSDEKWNLCANRL